jgi:hypothetical protein
MNWLSLPTSSDKTTPGGSWRNCQPHARLRVDALEERTLLAAVGIQGDTLIHKHQCVTARIRPSQRSGDNESLRANPKR